jgi:hypothetical protein
MPPRRHGFSLVNVYLFEKKRNPKNKKKRKREREESFTLSQCLSVLSFSLLLFFYYYNTFHGIEKKMRDVTIKETHINRQDLSKANRLLLIVCRREIEREVKKKSDLLGG